MPNELRSEAFLAAAMEDCGDAVYRLALCRLGSRADAEDVYQEVFLRLLRDTTDFSGAEHLKAWLLRVAMQRCTDLRRSAWFQRTAPLEAAPDAAAPEPDDHSDLWQAVRTRLHRARKRLKHDLEGSDDEQPQEYGRASRMAEHESP